MERRSFSSLGLVLAKFDYGEADRIFFILTRDYGKLPFIAKGVRRTKSRKRGSLELFNLVNFEASSGKNLDLIKDVEIVRSFDKIRKSLKKVTLAYYFSEVLLGILAEGEENRRVFNLAVSFFEDLNERTDLKALRREFLLELLSALGFWPKNKNLDDFDSVLERILEKKVNSKRVGLKILN
jgi:DNA repair protein RecO (recombination protein O)